MAENLLSLVILVLFICLAVWLIRALITAFAVPDPIATVIYVLVVLVVLFILMRSVQHAGLLSPLKL